MPQRGDQMLLMEALKKQGIKYQQKNQFRYLIYNCKGKLLMELSIPCSQHPILITEFKLS